MSTNDDSARRRAGQGEPDWRAASRSGNQYPGQNPRDSQGQQAAYSGYSRQSYSQQPYSQQRQEPPLPQPGQPYGAPQAPQGYYQEPAQQAPQGYYQDPAQQYYQEPRAYADPASPYAPPPQTPYDGGQQQAYGTGGELFGRDPGAPQNFEQNAYGAGGVYRQDTFDPYAPRQDNAPRFYAPEEQPQRSAPPLAQQPPLDRGYPQAPLYNPPPAAYDQQPVAQDNYQRGAFDPSFPGAQTWEDDEPRSGRPPMAAHHDEFDEEFPDEDFDGEEYAPKKGGRKKLFAALLLSAAAVVVGGAYGYKAVFGGKGERSTPLIQADHGPSREAPEKPGGKQYPHGEKAIYERLTPDGRTQVASFEPGAPAPIAVPQAFSAPAAGGGSSLEDRIDEALKRAQKNGDAPPDQPTLVPSEHYRPDGTRVEGRPVITPNIVNVDSGLPYPFGNATPPAGAAASAPPAGFRPAPAAQPAQPQFSTQTAPTARMAAKAPARPAPAPAAPEPSLAPAVPASAGGFYVSLKSAPDEKGIQKDLPALTEKYRSVLGDVQLTTKIADLGARGVTYRAVAGPLGTKQEASDLCTKIKGVGGDKACFVTN